MAFSKHLKAISAGLVTKSNVIGLRKAINADNRRGMGYSTSQTCPKVESHEIIAALSRLAELRPRVDAELHASGAAILNSRRYRSRWTRQQAAVIAGLDHFELVGFDIHMAHGHQYAVPIYRAVSFYGDSFKFINPSWQSGGNGPKVIP